MSAPQFTPGPWHVILDAFHVGNKRVASFHPSAIAKVYGDEPKDDDPKSTANARLIAAAPELYEALEALLPENCGRNAGTEAKARVNARAALAKARGEQ